MQSEVFISNSINESIETYINFKDKDYSLEYNSFICSIFRMLVLIYGEEELVDSYDKKSSEDFDNILMKYGLDVSKLDEFKINFEKYYKMKEKYSTKSIKKKNKFFNLVQKNVIDMLIQKKNMESIDDNILNEFYDLLFTANSKSFYQKSVAVLEAYNPYEIDNYAKKIIFGVDE